MHGARQELDDHEQHIQPLTARKGHGISISNVEAAAGPTIPALRSAAAGRVGGYGDSLLPQCRERHNEVLGQRAGADSFLVGESGRRRTRRMRKGDSHAQRLGEV